MSTCSNPKRELRVLNEEQIARLNQLFSNPSLKREFNRQREITRQRVIERQREIERQRDIDNRRRGIEMVRVRKDEYKQKLAISFSIYQTNLAMLSTIPKSNQHDRKYGTKLVNTSFGAVKHLENKIAACERDIAKYEAELFAIENPTLLDHVYGCL